MTLTQAVPGPPASPDVEALEAGIWWDAARVPAFLGARVLAELGEGTGAVIYDPYGQLLYWLTRPGSTDRWKPLPGIQPLSTATYVGVPSPRRTDGHGVRWLVPLTEDRYLTAPGRLFEALAAAVEDIPHPPAVAECVGCRNATSHPVQIRDGHGGLDHACPYCAPEYEPGPALRELLDAAQPYRRPSFRPTPPAAGPRTCRAPEP